MSREIGFTGICLFVRHRTEHVVTVLLPDARKEKTSKDGKHRMRAHVARVLHFPYGRKDHGTVEQYRLPEELLIPANSEGTPPDAVLDCEYLVDFTRLAGGVRIKRPSSVVSRITLRQGRCVCTRGEFDWVIRPPVPGGPDEPVRYYAYLGWEFDGDLPSAPLKPVGSHRPANLKDLRGDIEIWHVPSAHLPPHQHPGPKRGDRDDDFRWFYELADVPAHVGRDLPIPVIETVPAGPRTIHTHTCLPGGGDCEDDNC